MFEELSESELGTKQYWDERYKLEVKNYRDNGDVGDIWFGEDIMDRIVQWMDRNCSKSINIVEIGCGNGLLLIELNKRGFKDLTGIDYSQDAVILAQEIARDARIDIKYIVGDILDNYTNQNQYDVVLDKGTFDAISLMCDSKNCQSIYVESVHKLLKTRGLLIITSCNWTEQELLTHFDGKFDKFETIPTPQFKFGGKVGNVVSSVIFKRKLN